ncbi:MAG: hypothetical protein KF914_04500 [Rhizobiaceae bacterium]|nr:hypothetical protein [Rhizobiaceae bacterium]
MSILLGIAILSAERRQAARERQELPCLAAGCRRVGHNDVRLSLPPHIGQVARSHNGAVSCDSFRVCASGHRVFRGSF